jgi:uncharacterized protein YfaS (alpha-2-macroglobulin family)
VFVRFYPGVFSSVMAGAEGMLKVPSGCFEQTSSTAYPNALIARYLKQTKQMKPELLARCEQLLQIGYQRLVSYECKDGGFDWFGRSPGSVILTAYGLMLFHDMGEVFHVDEDMVTRTTNWLVEQQSADGSWAGNKQTETFAIHGRLLQTAYVVWALSEIGYTGEAGKKGMAYIRTNWKDVSDPYLLALVAAAGTGTDLDDLWSSRRLDELEALKKTSADGKTMWWDGSASVTVSGGGSLSIESTSLAALTMMKMKRRRITGSDRSC